MKKTRVLIVDDSALVRKLLSKILNSDREIEVVGTAGDPYIARDKIKQLEPDVITLDVEMPRMDGLTFLSNLMRLHPLPVVMISSLTDKGAEVTLRALELGAIDFVSKPKLDLADALETYTEEIVEKVKIAARSKVRPLVDRTAKGGSVEPKNDADVILQRSARRSHFRTTEMLIAIGASTGGTEAIKEVLSRLPPDAPGIVIAQHIPGAFSRPFAERVNQTSAMKVTEAEDGREILPGHAFIAPGSCHLLVERSGARFRCRLNDGPKVNRHKPSVDVLFRSVAENVGPNSIGVILTGMGEDGARGLREMRDSGSRTVAQDEASSVVWGMPGRAVELEAAEVVLPLGHIAGKLMGLTQG